MQHFRTLDHLRLDACHLAVGTFDGVHLGHQHIIRQLVDGARKHNLPAVVLTFFPHPQVVLRGRRPAFYINTPDEKAELLGKLGVEVVITQRFDRQVSRVRAGDFVRKLVDHLGLRRLWVTEDFALGYRREGNLPFLQNAGQEHGFEVQAAEMLKVEGEVISSTRVREALRAGDVARAGRYLGRPFEIPGKVVEGSRRGQRIGIPTANLDLWDERAYPARGVYVCRVTAKDGQRAGVRAQGAVTNIGVRPTFEKDGVAPTVEAHLLDFEGDLYGRELRLAFIERLRDERKFSGVEALLAQIRRDIAAAREILG